jgi:hypothetical protein
MNGTKLHSEYTSVGFAITEEEMLRENGLFDQVQSLVPNFKISELQQNTYSLYTKQYSSWSTECYANFTTRDV